MHNKASTEYAALKRRAIARGFSLHSWARQKGYSPSTVYMAAKGRRAGVKATRIQRELKELTHG